jgi:hypothetical protein
VTQEYFRVVVLKLATLSAINTALCSPYKDAAATDNAAWTDWTDIHFERMWPDIKWLFQADIFLDRMRNPMKNIIQDLRCIDWSSKRTAPFLQVKSITGWASFVVVSLQISGGPTDLTPPTTLTTFKIPPPPLEPIWYAATSCLGILLETDNYVSSKPHGGTFLMTVIFIFNAHSQQWCRQWTLCLRSTGNLIFLCTART